MLSNLLHPWLLARVVLGVAVSLLLVAGVRTAIRVLRHWRVGATSEGQLALERRAELVSAIVQVALVLAIAGLALTILAADRLSGSVRGAMCAYGVLDSTPGGWLVLLTGAAAAVACALWVVLHRLDLRFETPVLTRRKLVSLLIVAPVVWLDLGATLAFVLRLDLAMISSCCSAELDVAAAATDYGTPFGPRATLAAGALVAALAAVAAAAWAQRRPGATAAAAVAIASLAAAFAAIPAVLYYVAPHAYEVPHHHCPFCLLRPDVAIGWPLFAALGTAAILGLAPALVAAAAPRAGRRSPPQSDAMLVLQRRLARAVLVSWVLTLALAGYPVLRYTLATAGASLFAGAP